MSIIAKHCSAVYVASPISTYHTSHYDRMVSMIRERFRKHRILPARDLLSSNEDWLRQWRCLLPRLDRIVVFADKSGVIGGGVFKEVFDARVVGVPVHFLTDDGRLVPVSRLRFQFLNGDDLRHFARVIYPHAVGLPVDPGRRLRSPSNRPVRGGTM